MIWVITCGPFLLGACWSMVSEKDCPGLGIEKVDNQSQVEFILDQPLIEFCLVSNYMFR